MKYLLLAISACIVFSSCTSPSLTYNKTIHLNDNFTFDDAKVLFKDEFNFKEDVIYEFEYQNDLYKVFTYVYQRKL